MEGVPLLLFLAVEEETSWILENFDSSICDIILGKISGDVMLNSKIILYWIEIWNYRLRLVVSSYKDFRRCDSFY